MKIHVVAFATVGDVLGRELNVELADGSRVEDLKTELAQRHPELAAMWPRLAIAVDGEIASPDDALSDGVEVAILPPVSGGAPTAVAEIIAPAAERAAIVDEKIDVGTVERLVAAPNCGAVLLFLGTVRDHHQGRSVARLTYTAYRSMARKALARIVEELPERTAIVHRVGDVPVGEPSVVIAVASPHREAAYETSRTALERLKREVPIWKREHYADGEVVWREEEPLV